jgi:hypothetical protein
MDGRCSDGDAGTGGGSAIGGGSGGAAGGGAATGGGVASGGGAAMGGGTAMGGGSGGGGSAMGGGSATGGGTATGCALANPDAGAPFQIYRSLGDSSALATGNTNTMTIIGGCATFASALPARACVGDALQLASDGGSIDTIVFLSRRLDAQHFEVRTATGSMPADVAQPLTVWSLFRSYRSFYEALYGPENPSLALPSQDTFPVDLVAADAIWNIAITADHEATGGTGSSLQNFQTDADHYVRVFAPSLPSEVGVSQRHTGVWDDTKARLVASFQYPVIQGAFVNFRIEGLQIKNTYAITANDSAGGIGLWGGGGTTWYVTDNILVFGGTGSSGNASGVGFVNGSGLSTMYIVNNIISGWPGRGVFAYAGAGIFPTVVAYDNTVVNNGYRGFEFGSDNTSMATVYLRNNLATGNGTDYDVWGPTVLHASFNLSGDFSAVGDAGTRLDAGVVLKDPAAGDFRLSNTDTAAKGHGADLSADPQYPFSTDIAGQPRTVPWDLGASNAVP